MSRFFLQQQTPGRPPAKLHLEKEITIGRDDLCTVSLQNDDLVSRNHARVGMVAGTVVVKDQGSTNGTTIAGVKIKEAVLKVGQHFRVGNSTFLLVEEADPKPRPVPPPPPPPAVTKPAPPPAGAMTKPGLMAKAKSALGNFKVTETSDDTVFTARAPMPLLNVAPAPGTTPPSMEQLAQTTQRLAALNRIGHALSSLLDVDALLEELVSQVIGLFPRADTCCVLMQEGGELRPVKVVQKSRAGDGEIRLSKTVVQMNRYERKAVLSNDTTLDRRLANAESIVASGIRSVMSVPVVCQEEFFGILYVDTGDVSAPFTTDDLDLLSSLAGQLGVFVKNARLVSEIQRETVLRTNLGRYLSPSVVSEIAAGHLNPSLGGEQRDGTVLFSDIVGFTRLCRELSAADVVALLNTFFEELVDAVFKHDGTVDKFGGDAMLCVWGAPVSLADHAGHAIAGALEMQNRLFGFNLDLLASGSTVQVRMGIGLNSGSFIAGNVGSERRLEYTVIGDDVNLAQRVEEKATGGMVLVADSTRHRVPGAAAIQMMPINIRGAAGEFTVHSVRAVPIVRSVRNSAMLASIPAKAGHSSDGEKVDALVVGFVRNPAGLQCTVRVPAHSGLAEAVVLDVEFLLPECPERLKAVGKVMSTKPAEAGRAWRDVEVLFPALPPTLEVVLQAGSCWKSPLSPTDIKRA